MEVGMRNDDQEQSGGGAERTSNAMLRGRAQYARIQNEDGEREREGETGVDEQQTAATDKAHAERSQPGGIERHAETRVFENC